MITDIETDDLRLIKTYGRRSGRMREGEKEALEKVLPLVQIKADRVLNFEELFGRKAPVFLEIGFGNGAYLFDKAVSNPGSDFIGIEVYYTGVAKLLRRILKASGRLKAEDRRTSQTEVELESLLLPNIRVIIEDSRVVFEETIPPSSLDGVYILFPDPWPKKRHHKRRLINANFTELLNSRLKDGGFVVTATDDSNYAEAIGEAFSERGFSRSEAEDSGMAETKYARKAVKEGRGLNVVKWDKAGIRK